MKHRITIIMDEVPNLQRRQDGSLSISTKSTSFSYAQQNHFTAEWSGTSRDGNLESRYFCNAAGKTLLEKVAKHEVCFHGVLGKHSEVNIRFNFTFSAAWEDEHRLDPLGLCHLGGLDVVGRLYDHWVDEMDDQPEESVSFEKWLTQP